MLNARAGADGELSRVPKKPTMTEVAAACGVSQATDFRLALAVGHSIVPEPGTAPMILIGLAILGSRRTHGRSGRG